MILRAADVADAAAVGRLEEDLFGADAWSPAAVLAELSAETGRAVVAAEGGELVGYALTRTSDDVVDLVRIAVHPSRRRRGLARELLAVVVDRSRGEGADRVLLEVSERNVAAVAFYAAQGFVQVDRRRRYYRDGSDALVLRLPLDRAACGGERMAT